MAHNNLGLGLVRKGGRSGLDEFRKAYELAPGNATIRANYEWSLKQSGKK